MSTIKNTKNNSSRTKKKVKGALKYPLFLVAMAIGVLVLICVVVMPMCQGIFDQL